MHDYIICLGHEIKQKNSLGRVSINIRKLLIHFLTLRMVPLQQHQPEIIYLSAFSTFMNE